MRSQQRRCTLTNDPPQRLRVIVDGRVQGVGFRYATYRQAVRLGLKGWVRNLYDGRVEALFEGPRETLESMRDWCEQGPRFAHVTELKVTWQPATGEYQEFQILS